MVYFLNPKLTGRAGWELNLMTNITTTEHIHNLIKTIVEKEENSIPLLHLYMMAHLPGLTKAVQ